MTVLRAGVVTDTGRLRQSNQDAPLSSDADELWAVADGMGGHRGGDVASDLAVRALREAYAAGERTLDALLDAAAAANATVYDAAANDPDLRGMGTTLVAVAHTDDDEVAYISVGDSRIYLLRDGALTQLTVDHSLVGELVRDGSITPEEARTHPKRNIITRVLGIDPSVQVDSASIIPYEGDRFLLCSDGLFGEIDDDRIASVLRRLADPADAAAELVRLANESGGRDNITVLVLDVVDDGGRAEAASALIEAGAHADPAGFAAGAPDRPDDDVAADHARAAAAAAAATAAATPAPKPPRRLTWRVAGFVVIVLAVLAGGAAAIGYYARGTYYVGYDGDRVTVFQGKPGGVLWFDPTVVERTDLTRADVKPELRDQLEDGIEHGDRDEAFASLTKLTTTTTSTTTTSTTSTTAATATTTPTSTP